jgi:hypothetical protein
MLYFIILTVFAVVVIIIGKMSTMLRTEIFNIDNFRQITLNKGIKKPRPAYSLGRTQLAFWTVIIVSSFIYTLILGLLKGPLSLPKIDPVNLLLLGIAGGTTSIAKVIDNSQQNNQGDAIPQQDMPSKGFFTDIISDEKGVSVHRLQNVVWIIIVGFIYIASVFERKILPDQTVINNQLLGLMGISAGAYLGLKTTENQNAPVSPATVNTAAVSPPINPLVPGQSTGNNLPGKVGTL